MAARSSVLIFFPFGNVNICARLIDGFQIVKKCTRYLEMNSKAYKYVPGPPEPGGPGGHWPPQSFRKSMHKRVLAPPKFSRFISSGPLKDF